MKAKEILAIIKACKASGVSSFQFQGLNINFSEQDQPAPIFPGKIEDAVTASDSPDNQEADLDLLMVEDPSAYERLYADMQQEANQ